MSDLQPLQTPSKEGEIKIVHEITEAKATKQWPSEYEEWLEADAVIFQKRYVRLIRKQTWHTQTQGMIRKHLQSTCSAEHA